MPFGTKKRRHNVTSLRSTVQHGMFPPRTASFIFTLLSLLLKSHLLSVKDINTACGLCHLSALEVVVGVREGRGSGYGADACRFGELEGETLAELSAVYRSVEFVFADAELIVGEFQVRLVGIVEELTFAVERCAIHTHIAVHYGEYESGAARRGKNPCAFGCTLKEVVGNG